MSLNILRVGRGGAGNFMNKEAVQDAEMKAASQDPEAQQSVAASKPPAGPGWTRGGRGGAGNFKESSASARANGAAAEAEQTIAALVSASAGKPKTGLTGRGGLGNWTDKRSQGAEVDKKRRAVLEAKILHDVEAELALPPRIYRQHERDSVN